MRSSQGLWLLPEVRAPVLRNQDHQVAALSSSSRVLCSPQLSHSQVGQGAGVIGSPDPKMLQKSVLGNPRQMQRVPSGPEGASACSSSWAEQGLGKFSSMDWHGQQVYGFAGAGWLQAGPRNRWSVSVPEYCDHSSEWSPRLYEASLDYSTRTGDLCKLLFFFFWILKMNYLRRLLCNRRALEGFYGQGRRLGNQRPLTPMSFQSLWWWVMVFSWNLHLLFLN